MIKGCGSLILVLALFLPLWAPCALGRNLRPSDIPSHFTPPNTNYDYTERDVMILMRDGVKLFTVIFIPRWAHHAPILLERTPYNAAGQRRAVSPHLLNVVPLRDDIFVKAGYIIVFQDVRGKYGSQGSYLMNPPPRGPLNPHGPNDTTDAYDTISWLVKNIPQSNGRVGMIGSSYDGFTVVMALLHPNPALKVAAPESPMVNGWMGDDWFHYGAFRENNLDYFRQQTSHRGAGTEIPRVAYDNFTNFLHFGSAGNYARYGGLDQLPFWKLIHDNPSYDAFWQDQALETLIGRVPLNVPILWVQGLWDQEDMWGANHCYEAVEPLDTHNAKHNNKNYLVMGPWWHGQENSKARSIGPLRWNGDTALYFRQNILLPFFNQYLKPGAPKAAIAPVTIFNTGEDRWNRYQRWPQSCDTGCRYKSRQLYLRANGEVSFNPPAPGDAKYDAYVSDPAKPVPYLPRPVTDSQWQTWLVTDQRFVDGRPDVLTFKSQPLTTPLRLAGAPVVHLYASTSGTDSDWVVKLIDVYPPTNPYRPNLGGYELPISLDIFRGRYRTSFSQPEPIPPGQPLLYRFTLPNVNHVYLPGHRIMVQVQSTLYPLYDRNPQTFVPNIFDAKPGDYRKAVKKIWHTPGDDSFIDLPVVP